MPTKKKANPKRVVYLLGAGATQAEVDYLGARPVNLLMRNTDREGVAARVLKGLNAKWRRFLGEDEGADIEKLISLLAASGVDSLVRLAERIRQEYFWDIRNHLVEAQIINCPKLAQGLLEMHNSEHFKENVETLTGILTTNHDGLLQVASQRVFGEVNLGFLFKSDHGLIPAKSPATPPILALHGSFTWKFGVPMQVSKLNKRSPTLAIQAGFHQPFSRSQKTIHSIS